MKLLLLLFALQFIVVTSSKNDPLWKHNHERKVKFISENQQQAPSNVAPAGPYCQSLVAYFVGTFQSRSATTPSFNAQFQVRLNADLKKKRITVEADQWAEKYGKSGDFALDYYYSNSYEWCDIKEEECSSSFSRNITTFTLDLNRQDGTYFHLLHFDYFNNSFALDNSDGKCTKFQLGSFNDEQTPNLNKLNMCVCCDSYAPDDLLGCPQDPWNDIEITTPAPIVKKTTTAKPAPPPPSNITCKSIVAYYNGIFSNDGNPNEQMPVEFQTRMYAGGHNYYTDIDQWNTDRTKSSNIRFFLFEPGHYKECSPPTNNNCSFLHSIQSDIWLDVEHWVNGNYLNQYWFSYFPAFNGQFTLYNAVNGCTKFQPVDSYSPIYVANPAYFNFCMCCGDTYSPDESLGCPDNPWA